MRHSGWERAPAFSCLLFTRVSRASVLYKNTGDADDLSVLHRNRSGGSFKEQIVKQDETDFFGKEGDAIEHRKAESPVNRSGNILR